MQGTSPSKTHQEQEHTKYEQQCTDIVKVLDELDLSCICMLHTEVRWSVEQKPAERAKRIHASQKVEYASPAD